MRRLLGIATVALVAAALGAATAGGQATVYASAKLAIASLDGGLRIGATVAATDDPTAKLAIYVPSGYGIASPAAGTPIGTATGTAAAADLAGAILPFTGELAAVDPTMLPAAEQEQVGQCLQGRTASQTWLLTLTAIGQTLEIPVLVVPAVAPETAAGFQAVLVVCLQAPDLPPGTGGRAPFGAKVLSLSFGVHAITQPATPAEYHWTAVFTPYTPGAGTYDAGAVVESQARQRTPAKIGIEYTRDRVVTRSRVGGHVRTIVKTRVRFTTTLSERGTRVAGAVRSTVAGKRVGSSHGTFSFTTPSVVLTSVGSIDARTTVPTGAPAAATDVRYTDLGAADCIKTPMFGGIPCLDATLGAASVRTKVRIPALG